MTKTILVTGGAGFIGSHLVNRLIIEGYDVVVIDDFNDYYNPFWKEQNIAHYVKYENFRLYRGSITDKNILNEIFKKEHINIIIHLAARAGVRPSIEDPHLYYEVNIVGTLNLLECARKYNVKDFVFISSSSVYGNFQKAILSEDERTDKQASPYGATKKSGELLVYTYHHLFGLSCVILRFFTVYGERSRPDMAPYLFTDALLHHKKIKKFGNGFSQRDYTYVGDIVDGITKCLEKNFSYEIINLGNSSPVTFNDLIAILEEITGEKAEIDVYLDQPGDVLSTHADITKAKNLLGWVPKTSLREGLLRFVIWYRKNRL